MRSGENMLGGCKCTLPLSVHQCVLAVQLDASLIDRVSLVPHMPRFRRDSQSLFQIQAKLIVCEVVRLNLIISKFSKLLDGFRWRQVSLNNIPRHILNILPHLRK